MLPFSGKGRVEGLCDVHEHRAGGGAVDCADEAFGDAQAVIVCGECEVGDVTGRGPWRVARCDEIPERNLGVAAGGSCGGAVLVGDGPGR